MDATKFHGTVKRVIAHRGFGFVARDDQQQDVFFHLHDTAVDDFDERLVGKRVTFDIATNAKGFRATNVEVVDY